jgi:hypothetical protein
MDEAQDEWKSNDIAQVMAAAMLWLCLRQRARNGHSETLASCKWTFTSDESAKKCSKLLFACVSAPLAQIRQNWWEYIRHACSH